MAETDTWTPADDDYVREALGSLKTDVDALPLADVRFVKARGRARRRRTMLGWTAGAAAAALVAAVIGFSALGGDNATHPVPPATGTTTAPTTAPTTPLDRQAVSPYLAEPGALPLGKEWKLALGWSTAFEVQTVTSYEADLCLGPNGGTPREAETLLSGAGNIQGGQTRWTAGSSTEAQKVADAMARSIGACRQGQFAVKGVQTTGWPRLYTYTAGDAGSGWYAVTHAGNEVAVLTVTEPDHPKTEFERAEVERLAAIATARLERYGSGTTSTPSGPTGTTAQPSGEDMPVVGSQPAVSSSLFVPASQWSSQELTQGARTYAGLGAQEGSASIAQCETDQFQAGVGGRYGIVSIRSGSGQANYIGKQRVRLDDSTSSAQQQSFVQARLAEAKALYGKGCTFGNGTVKATPGPTEGTWRLDTVFKDGSPTLTEWVGVTAQQTPGAMTTIVLTKVPNPKLGFPELDRLLVLARQR
ncbi:hypothetical protein SAMN05216199_4017 [Pedococcus cremeus]|uniref:Uncharacterized protein n=1 Tax=Pedococcus cremeus TaxID=587636 RepID=A0A1H9XLV2_9MICO|nr:hypothetical protein [Pedococcus cremeus]SES47156.1 hypothetical protein SAMN05216199_4017 [Pedococcus cremeus]